MERPESMIILWMAESLWLTWMPAMRAMQRARVVQTKDVRRTGLLQKPSRASSILSPSRIPAKDEMKNKTTSRNVSMVSEKLPSTPITSKA